MIGTSAHYHDVVSVRIGNAGNLGGGTRSCSHTYRYTSIIVEMKDESGGRAEHVIELFSRPDTFVHLGSGTAILAVREASNDDS